MTEKLEKIINHYGIDHQMRKLVEEVYELIDASAEMRYNSTNFANNYQRMINHILEEWTDCKVLMEQIRLYWQLDKEDIKEVFEAKVDRTIEGIEKERQ